MIYGSVLCGQETGVPHHAYINRKKNIHFLCMHYSVVPSSKHICAQQVGQATLIIIVDFSMVKLPFLNLFLFLKDVSSFSTFSYCKFLNMELDFLERWHR